MQKNGRYYEQKMCCPECGSDRVLHSQNHVCTCVQCHTEWVQLVIRHGSEGADGVNSTGAEKGGFFETGHSAEMGDHNAEPARGKDSDTYFVSVDEPGEYYIDESWMDDGMEEDDDWEDEEDDDVEPDHFFYGYHETCDWCGGSPVVYRDEAFSLCEFCADQMMGD